MLLSFEGEVKLTDFGIARSRDARRPTGGISGTIPFMSPEQARGEPVDLRSDVFSAGVVLYALLSGECPFGEEDTGGTLEQVRLCRYKPPCGSNGSSASSRCCDARSTRTRDSGFPARARSPTRSTS